MLLRLVAEKEGVAAKVLASGDDIDRMATDGEEADVPALHGWRREVFGEQALKLVRGEIAHQVREAPAGGVRDAVKAVGSRASRSLASTFHYSLLYASLPPAPGSCR